MIENFFFPLKFQKASQNQILEALLSSVWPELGFGGVKDSFFEALYI